MHTSGDLIFDQDFQTDCSGSNSGSAPIDALAEGIESLRISNYSDVALLVHFQCSCKVSYHHPLPS